MPLRERDGNWHYRFWLDGREYTANTDLVATERNRNGATRVEAKARELVASGRAHELKLQVRPFNDAATDFLTWADGEYRDHPSSAKRLRTSFVSLSSFFGKVPVSSILRGHVNDFKAWRRKEHQVREITIRHDLHALSKAFGYFIDHNWARDNPLRGVKGLIPSDKDAVRIHVLTAPEEALYFETARARFPRLYDLGRLMLNQGCRPEEILELGTADIDLVHSSLTIRKGKSTAARRQLRLTGESREICARLMMSATSRWLFPGRLPGTRLAKLNGPHGTILDELAVCKCTHREMEHLDAGKCRCGCAEFREASRLAFVIYDFRHTFATRAAESGMPVATLARILGHGDLRSVMKYIHVRQDAQDRAMEDFEAHGKVQNIQTAERSSGFRPVEDAEKRDFAGLSGNSREGLNARKSN
jgi:integrase